MDTRIAEILTRLSVMEERLTTLNHEYGQIAASVSKNALEAVKMGKDVDWLKKFFWIVVATSASSLVAILWQALRGG